jgi:Protein of unknown function (DUF1553)/Protein of unknown function (DUF1549)/Planctomycete cytochrome C
MLARLSSIRCLISLFTLTIAVQSASADDKIAFNRDIRPILTNNCFKCHGPAGRKGGFRLDLRDEATKPARSGAVPIVPGKSADSELVKRIFASAKDEVMPPPATHKSLKAAEKDLIQKWIDEGAVYQKHWSFESPVKVAPPLTVQAPANPIDAFIAARLKLEGFTLSPEADRSTLIRRVSFALTGFPPTPAEVNAFLADTSTDAYEKMVDRYLASKHYGEEMARHWLDIARYGDTHGLHLDNERHMWLYRDWVVSAFNRNLPFDRFTIEQLAGDLLPSPTKDQLIATGFNRCNVSTNEGGSIDAEWVFRNALDRTSTMSEAFLGLTAGCAVCHDHKFDPLSAKEYYSLYAFFYSVDGPPLDGNAALTGPTIKYLKPEQEKRLAELSLLIVKAQQELAEAMKNVKYDDPADQADKTPEANNPAPDPAHSFKAWLKREQGKDNKGFPPEIRALLKQAKRDAAADGKLRDYYLRNVCLATKATFEPLTKMLAGLTQERDGIDKSAPATLIFKELANPREAHLMVRGQYDKPGEKVEPNTPAILPPLVKANPKRRATRLDLANWLFSAEHPLTSRVAVNRYWQQFFGTGLVRTSSDFGAQGELPSHPELLNYLAISYRENGWDTKALVRLMLTSATFRQSAKVTAEMLKRDPDNRLYARGPRFRLDAEQIRDNALFVSGLINLDMGGRGVRPYQPLRIWEPVAFSGSNTMNYVADKGASLYRRSLYTFLKRTAPPPYLANFDAPNRESPCGRRERSNTPLQALQLMNDVQHFEAARRLAERIMTEGGKTAAERIGFAFMVVLSREPDARERETLQRTLTHFMDRFQKDPEAAKKAVRIGESPLRPGSPEPELAAYTLLANLILNLDETLTRN